MVISRRWSPWAIGFESVTGTFFSLSNQSKSAASHFLLPRVQSTTMSKPQGHKRRRHSQQQLITCASSELRSSFGHANTHKKRRIKSSGRFPRRTTDILRRPSRWRQLAGTTLDTHTEKQQNIPLLHGSSPRNMNIILQAFLRSSGPLIIYLGLSPFPRSSLKDPSIFFFPQNVISQTSLHFHYVIPLSDITIK